MTDVRPFKGLRFARDPEPRIAGPYDCISDADRVPLAAQAENIVHLTLPPGPEGDRHWLVRPAFSVCNGRFGT